MRLKLFCLAILFSWHHAMYAQLDLTYYLPEGVQYDESIPTPQVVVGHEVGEWHISHDKLVQYMYAVSDASDRIIINEYARTYENRPLLNLIITSSDNHSRLEEIRQQHLELTDPQKSVSLDIANMPAVLYMGYSVHGNEASGSNAALVAAYHLAAAQGKYIDDVLKNTIIILDPSYNPDGLNRYASWVNSHKSANLVTDPNNLEQNEAWPGGRTNHYWFDLNRDWLPVQMPESKGRIQTFHSWKPNVLTDHHEMGTNSTYFFQPGIPSRNHPLTPANNYVLTEKIAQYHAKYLDQIGSLYYSKESFDDFYYGKGSTFPDINGGVGILFEQASARSHAQESTEGILKFPFAIKNHFTTTLSTINAVLDIRTDLLQHQRNFYKSALDESNSDPVKAYIFSDTKDSERNLAFLEVLLRHQINCYEINRNVTANGLSFDKNSSYIIPLQQKQYRLIKAIFERRTSFQDSLFYDVSAWTLPLAFNLTHSELRGKSFDISIQGKLVSSKPNNEGEVIGGESSYAYAFEWHEYLAPKVLNQLHANGMITKVALEPFTDKNGKTFDRGTILIPVKLQSRSSGDMYQLMQSMAKTGHVNIYNISSGYTSGYNLGSPNFKKLKKVKPLIIAGEGVRGYDVGEIWHLLDQRMQMQLSQVSISKFNKIDLDKYNTLIMVQGKYNGINVDKLKKWIQSGGIVITMKSASKWIADNGIGNLKYVTATEDGIQEQRPYNMLSRYKGAQVIGGAIFNATLDLTHPIAFGYSNDELSLFRNGRLFMDLSKNPYTNPVKYTWTPLLSGYISKENENKLKGTAAVGVSVFGKGRVISFTDNPNFRAFWYGTNKLFLNSLFFGSIIAADSAK